MAIHAKCVVAIAVDDPAVAVIVTIVVTVANLAGLAIVVAGRTVTVNVAIAFNIVVGAVV